MMKKIALGLTILVTNIMSAHSQEVAVIHIDEIKCRDMLKLDAEEQEYTLIYFHGFLSGARDERMFKGPILQAATEAVFDHCIDNPSSTLMKAFEAQR